MWGQAPVAILSHGYWRQQFGATAGAIGQTLEINGTATAVIGVMPAEFTFPNRETKIWLPRSIPAVDDGKGNKRGVILRAWARLRPGVTAAQASAEGTARANAATDAGPVAMALFGARGPIQVTAVDAREAATAEVRPAILILLAAAVLLFVTAVANVANLQVARSTSRHRELTIRAAIGASLSRLARQLLIENAILGLLGGAAGLLIAVGLHAALPSLVPIGFPRVDAIGIDRSVLLFCLVLTVATSVACGVLPLLQVRRLELVRALAEGGLASSGPGKGSRMALTRDLMVLLGGFATFALLIAGTGLFAVLSYTVTQRSRELAVRSTLGATRRDLVGLVFRQMTTTGGGLVAGLAAAWAMSASLAPFVYGVSTWDGVSVDGERRLAGAGRQPRVHRAGGAGGAERSACDTSSILRDVEAGL